MINAFCEINPDLWGIDSDPFFVTGKGYWAKADNTKQIFDVTAIDVGQNDMIMRVRTGDKTSSTNYVSTYALTLDGVNIPLTLDESRPPVWNANIWGGAWLGFLKFSINVPDKAKRLLEFTAKKIYGAWDGMSDLKTGPSDEDVQKAYEKGLAEGEAKGIEIGKTQQREADVKESQANYKDVTERQYYPLA